MTTTPADTTTIIPDWLLKHKGGANSYVANGGISVPLLDALAQKEREDSSSSCLVVPWQGYVLRAWLKSVKQVRLELDRAATAAKTIWQFSMEDARQKMQRVAPKLAIFAEAPPHEPI